MAGKKANKKFIERLKKKDFTCLFLERRKGKEKEREKNINVRDKH